MPAQSGRFSLERGGLRARDTLVAWKLDRLGRSVRNLVDMASSLQVLDAQFKSLIDTIDTGTRLPNL